VIILFIRSGVPPMLYQPQIAYEFAELGRLGAPRNRDIRPNRTPFRRSSRQLKVEPAAGLATSQA